MNRRFPRHLLCRQGLARDSSRQQLCGNREITLFDQDLGELILPKTQYLQWITGALYGAADKEGVFLADDDPAVLGSIPR